MIHQYALSRWMRHEVKVAYHLHCCNRFKMGDIDYDVFVGRGTLSLSLVGQCCYREVIERRR